MSKKVKFTKAEIAAFKKAGAIGGASGRGKSKARFGEQNGMWRKGKKK
jgi:hypothetical protein